MGNTWGIALHPRSARIARPGMSLSIGRRLARIAAEKRTVHRSAANKSRERAASEVAAAASPSATDDTNAAIRTPGAEAWRRRFSSSHRNGRCVRLSPAPDLSELVGGVDRPQQPEGAEGSNFLHVVGQQRPRPTNAGAALLELHRRLPSQAQTNQSPRITGADGSRWTAPDTTGPSPCPHCHPTTQGWPVSTIWRLKTWCGPSPSSPKADGLMPPGDPDPGARQFTDMQMGACSLNCPVAVVKVDGGISRTCREGGLTDGYHS